MYNAKAFLEGLIVNEVLTKTASFEKLAQPPGMYPPTVAGLVQAWHNQLAEQRAADAAHRKVFSEWRQGVKGLQDQRKELGLDTVLQRMPQAQRAVVARRIREGNLPTKEEVEEWAQKYPERPKNISPAGPAPATTPPGIGTPAPKATPPGMGTPGLKPPTSPSYPSYPPYPSQTPPSMSGDIKA
jgi:hypothetical protein